VTFTHIATHCISFCAGKYLFVIFGVYSVQPSQVGSLFTFLARQLAKPWCSLHVERQLFEQVVEFLTTDSGSSCTMGHHEERQQALLELIRAGGLSHYDQDRLLRLADKAAL
jgi:hypothetical protein